MPYKPNYTDNLTNLADFVIAQNNTNSTLTGPVSSLIPDSNSLNTFTGTLAQGYNISKGLQKDFTDTRTFNDTFNATVKMYQQQAEYAKQDTKALIDKQWAEQQINNDIALLQAKGALAEQHTLGTGAAAISGSNIDKAASENKQNISNTASETLLKAWTDIDETAANLINMTTKEYQEFTAQANLAEAEMWQWFLNSHLAANYTNLKDDAGNTLFDYGTNWQDALMAIGAIDKETNEYTEFGNLLAELIMNNDNRQYDENKIVIAGSDFRDYLKTSKNKDFWLQNSDFLRREYFGITDRQFDNIESYELFKQSDFKQETNNVNFETNKNKYIDIAEKSFDKEFFAGTRIIDNIFGNNKDDFKLRDSNTVGDNILGRADDITRNNMELKTSNDLNNYLGNTKVSTLKVGETIKLKTGKDNSEETWGYIGDGVFVKARKGYKK